MRAFVTEVVHDFKPPGGRTPSRLVLPSQDIFVRADRSKLAQALGNVLSNAYKYSPNGGEVDVVVTVRDDGPAAQARQYVCVTVRDRGIGMTREQLLHMGERFYRVDSSGSIPGTGLGVSIVKEIVELHGGEVLFESEPKKGSAITVWLPQAD